MRDGEASLGALPREDRPHGRRLRQTSMGRQPVRIASGAFVHIVLGVVLSLFLRPLPPETPSQMSARLVWAPVKPSPGAPDGGGQGGDRRSASPAAERPVVADHQPRFLLPRIPDAIAAVVLPGIEVAFAAQGRPVAVKVLVELLFTLR